MSESLKERLNEIEKKHLTKKNLHLKLSEYELKELGDKNYEAIIRENPITILNEYYSNIKYKTGKYNFSRRGEDSHASCFFYVKNGNWYYKDYGDSSANGTGTIINIIKENNKNLSYNEVIKLCLNKLNLTDYVKEALDVISLQNYYMDAQLKVNQYTSSKSKSIEEILKTADENAKVAKQNNSKIERESKILSRITYASKNIPKKFIDLLIARGIKENSKNFYYIKGENFKENENGVLIKTNSVEGVGVITANNENLSELVDVINEVEKKGYYAFNENLKTGVKFGGDVHIIPYLDYHGNKHKTRSFGVGGITIAKNKPLNKKVALFESKMDYHALDNYFKFNDNGYDVCIANSTNNLKKITSFLSESNYEEVFLANQFDLSALYFNINIMYETGIEKFKFIEYEKDEYKKDGNDLICDDVDIYKRIKIGTILDFKDQMDVVKENLKSDYDFTIMESLEEKLTLFEKYKQEPNVHHETSNGVEDEKKISVIRLNR